MLRRLASIAGTRAPATLDTRGASSHAERRDTATRDPKHETAAPLPMASVATLRECLVVALACTSMRSETRGLRKTDQLGGRGAANLIFST
ncbi:MAG: hypothetical protein ABGZ17_06080 [Planctomycetaceae bacterium]